MIRTRLHTLLALLLASSLVVALIPAAALGAPSAPDVMRKGGDGPAQTPAPRTLPRAMPSPTNTPDARRPNAAVSLSAEMDDDIPGVWAPAGGVLTGTLGGSDQHDVYRLSVPAWERLTVTLTGASGTDFDLVVLRGEAFDVANIDLDSAFVRGASLGDTYPEVVSSCLSVGEDVYIDVRAYEGVGAYTLTWSTEPDWAYVSGSLAPTADYDYDMWQITLSEGQRIRMAINGSAGAMCLFEPDCTDFTAFHGEDWWQAPHGAIPAAYYEGEIDYVVPPGGGGLYKVQVIDWAEGDYDLLYKVDSPPSVRFSGPDRYSTAQRMSRSTFTSANSAVLVSGASYPDALSAAGLAGALGAPLLLTQKDDIPLETLLELRRLNVNDIWIVGGWGVVSDAQLNDLKSLGYNVGRLSGADRYLTSAVVAKKALSYPHDGNASAFLVRGDAFPDALAAAPLAYQNAMPILLTQPGVLSMPVIDLLGGHYVSTLYPIGGTGALSELALSQARASGVGVAPRIAGANRYATAAALANWGIANNKASASFVGLATGENFPDALAGSVVSGSRGGVMLLTPSLSLNADTKSWLTAHSADIDRLALYGGYGAVSKTTGTDAETSMAQ